VEAQLPFDTVEGISDRTETSKAIELTKSNVLQSEGRRFRHSDVERRADIVRALRGRIRAPVDDDGERRLEVVVVVGVNSVVKDCDTVRPYSKMIAVGNAHKQSRSGSSCLLRHEQSVRRGPAWRECWHGVSSGIHCA
jgi:hypothetical protein